ncbi:type II toxin-antitoxin system YoeB family toxin [Propionicimonas sp.]|uniref:type II toxin-antitoxin system YoeB family toxin n=1 Tax=Propionicimonas sp. TaxID=1955623 RepID=UPI003D0B6EFA
MRRINALIQEILRDPFAGTAKARTVQTHPVRRLVQRIDDANRLVYLVTDKHIVIL